VVRNRDHLHTLTFFPSKRLVHAFTYTSARTPYVQGRG
jgi:hypothetical protein